MKISNKLTLNSEEVHIWSACLADNHNLSYFTSILSENEYNRAEDFKFFQDQRSYIITRGILKSLLANYLDQTPHSIEIINTIHGKPYLLKKDYLHFNLSHSKDYVLYAIAQKYEVGIDLEYIDKKLKLENIAEIVFSKAEFTYWSKLNGPNKTNTFFKIWVCKEAFLKALGTGWINNENKEKFTELEFLEINEKKFHLIDKISYPYCFNFVNNYASALFVNGPPLHLSYYEWS